MTAQDTSSASSSAASTRSLSCDEEEYEYDIASSSPTPSTSTVDTSELFVKPIKRKATVDVYTDDKSNDCGETKTKRKRGRPAKPHILLPPVIDTELTNLSEAEVKYIKDRAKNNVASRKSRANRRDREIKIEEEASELDQHYQQLLKQEKRLIKEHAKYKRAVMQLTLL